MSTLRRPIKDHLRATTSDASVSRMWRRIEARSRTPKRTAFGPSLAVAAIVLLLLGASILGLRAKGAAPTAGPLRHDSGSVFAFARAGDHEEKWAFEDRSELALSRGTSIDVLVNTSSELVLKQARGRARYEVTPGGPRHWVIECGIARVEVVGTSFTVDRDDSHVHVDVQRGTVLVRSESLPDHVVRLTSGMKVDVTDPALRSAITEPVPQLPVVTSDSLPVASTRAEIPRWKALAKGGENAKAYAELGPQGFSRAARVASVDDLFTLADVARLASHPAEAVLPLDRILAEYPSDSRASLAAFTLGRIHLDTLGDPKRAIVDFRRALDRGIPGGLAEDALVRLAEACSKAGDVEGARAAYAQHRARFPNGSRASEFAPWVQDP